MALLLLMLGGILSAVAQPANDNFADAIELTDIWGSLSGENTNATFQAGEPSHGGVFPQSSVWYRWTAPLNGEVQFDTLGTGGTNDTVLAVYTGENLATLTQVAANDDYYRNYQINETGQNIFAVDTNNPPAFSPDVSPVSAAYYQPYQGPSLVRFNAKAGTTYYISVSSKFTFHYTGFSYNSIITGPGSFLLNWAYHPSGTFRFASENIDQTGVTNEDGLPMLLHQVAETESTRVRGGPPSPAEFNTTEHTYYTYDAPGALVTVTRVAGSSGRVTVDYATVDGNTNTSVNGDSPAVAGVDYLPAAGTLVFDDYEMSKTIFIPIFDGGSSAKPNRTFTVELSNPQVDWLESWDVAAPKLENPFSKILVRILDADISPQGPSVKELVDTNTTPATTNLVYNYQPTNAVFNFEKANYRVTRDVSDWWGSTPVTVYVNRTGTNRESQTVNWRIDNYFLTKNGSDNQNNEFPLQPGSDYATPSPGTTGGLTGTNSDFSASSYSGTITFPGGNNVDPQPISFNVLKNNRQQFNEDLIISLYQTDKDGNVLQPGMVAQTTVTILFNDLTPPAGSVDQYYNADLALDLAPPTNTVPPQMVHPGTDGQVLGMAVLQNPLVLTNFVVTTNNGVMETNQTTTVIANDKAIIVGDFFSYDSSGCNRIAGVNPDGSLDNTFNPGSGANNFIGCIAPTLDGKFVIGGAFTSYNGSQRNRIARINADGSLDGSFNSGSGANGTIRAVAQQSDGKLLIGGEFTSYNGTPRQYLARLNADGSLDSNFDPGSSLNAPVFALGLEPTTKISLDRTALGDDKEDRQEISLGSTNAGVLTIDYDMLSVPDNLRVYYNGNRIYDTGYVNELGHLVIPFSGGTNAITIVLNEGGGQLGTAWSYSAQAEIQGASQVYVGGDFTSVGGVSGQDYVTRILNDGTVDMTFNPGAGPNGSVYALAVQSDGKILVGGEFSEVNGKNLLRIARLNLNGSLDDNFYISSGADGTVFNLNPQSDGTIYVGGSFTDINDTHRLGFARLNADGTVDTSFLDTAYNQFAGLPRRYFDDEPGTVLTSGVQSDGKVLIGGSFQFVGGGQFNPEVRNNLLNEGYDADVWPEPKTRDGIRNRSNFARLIGGATPGPGNIGLLYQDYSANKSQSSMLVSLVRTNGFLGTASANFSVLPGLATSGADYGYTDDTPLYWQSWDYVGPTRMHSDGLFGTNAIVQNSFGEFFSGSSGVAGQSYVTVSLLNNPQQSGDVAAAFQLSNPNNADQFFLGGQNIPLGVALGRPVAPFTIIDDHHASGVFSFASSSITATGNVASVGVIRTGGSYGVVQMNYATNSGSTAIYGVDFRLNPGQLVFNNGETARSFNVQILNSNSISPIEKTVNLRLFNLNAPANGEASLGQTNSVLRIINPNFEGFLSFSTNAYAANLSGGTMAVTVVRTVGSKGTLTIQYATTNGTALNGTDYVGVTNTLQWNSGDVSPRTILIPLLDQGTIGSDKQFYAYLSNPQLNGAPTPSLLGANTSAVLTITNDNNYGNFQFNAPSYTVNENGGSATITVNRTGSALGTAMVNFMTVDNTAVAGINYGATNGTLTFVPGQVSASFMVPILNDGVTNPSPANFNFNVALSVSAGALVGSPTNVPVFIVDAQSFNRPPGSADVVFNSSTTANDDVLALALQSSGQIVLGGNFTAVNGTPENHLARLNSNGTLDIGGFLNGLSGVNGTVRTIVSQSNDRLLIGGVFSQVNGVVRNYIARVNTDGTLDTSFNPGSGADNTVYALAETFINGSRKIYAGGAFTTMGGVANIGIARLNDNGVPDSEFNTGTGANGAVYALAVYPTNSIHAGKLLIGGDFTGINGTPRGRIARLNADGSLDASFDSSVGADGIVRAIAIQDDGRILLGGTFTNVNGIAATRIARLNSDGSIDNSFANAVGSGANDLVNVIVVQPDARILLGGQFTEANSVTRHRITRLLPSGAVDPTINFGDGANGDVNALVMQTDGSLVVGGGFTTFDGETHERIARIYGGSVTGSGVFEFTSGTFERAEDGAVAFVTVRRTGGTSGPNADGSGNITLHFTTSDGTAVAGVNYSPVTTDLVFPVGEVLVNVPILVSQDFVITPDLTVNLAISNPTSPASLGDQTDAVLKIVNQDSAVRFSSSAYSVGKNVASGVAAIQVVRNGTTGGTASVTVSTTDQGTAVSGVDYLPTTETVTFNPGETAKTVEIPIIDDGIPDGNKTVSLALTDPSGTVLSSPANATLTIIDTVVAPGQLSFGAASYTASEGSGVATITLVRTGGASGNVSVSYATIAGTAQSGINYLAANGTVSFADGQTERTFTVSLVDNSLVQGSVSLTLVLSNPTSGATLGSPTSATLTIMDNDEALVIVPSGYALTSESNPNGLIDPGETVTMAFGLRVSAGTNLHNLTATLLAANGIQSPSPVSQNYEALNVRGPSASREFSFNVDPAYTNGQQITAVFQLQEGANNVGTAEFNFILGNSTKVFSNTNIIVLNDGTNASPYPSTIEVSGVGTVLSKATVTLKKIKHSWPSDIDVLVKSPAQQKTLIMANAGGGNVVNGLDLTFDDAAGIFLPQGQLVSGTYKPTAYLPVTTFPSPAPAGPYATNLSSLNSGNPNGTWSLFVLDDTAFNSGAISNGWILTLTTTSPIGIAADVGVSIASASASLVQGETFTYTIGATNYGPSGSSEVVVSNLIPAGVSYVSAVATQGSAAFNNGVVTWNIGSLMLNQGAQLTVTATANLLGSQTNVVVVQSGVSDPNPADDFAALVIPVTSSQPPQLTGALLGGNGLFGLSISGAPVPTIIQASTNLINWIPVYTNTPPFNFSDPNAASVPYRFYRAVIAH